MRLCFIGKYPPIQGGVSAQSYWTMHALAERGHQIFVVTNAEEVEGAFRIHLRPEDRPLYEPAFPASGGFVKVRNVERFRHDRMSHIPASNPYVTRLSSVATDIVREHQCEIIFGSYFEPYGIAACLASHWTGVPYVVKHAGSDMDRLMKVSDMSTAYREMLRGASAIITRPPLADRFLRMGVSANKLRTRTSFALSPKHFYPGAAPLDSRQIQELAAESPDPINRSAIDLARPTIGIYGKVGETKGSFDLADALGILKRKGQHFNFLAVTHGYGADALRQRIIANDLQDQTWILPFVPHWSIPGIIRTCTAVCFLERDFPIAIHGPQVPREVLACGGCLVLSREIYDKQYYRERMKNGENLLVVNDPRDLEALSDILHVIITEPTKAQMMGAKAAELSREIEDYSRFVDGYESLLLEISGHTIEPRISLREATPPSLISTEGVPVSIGSRPANALTYFRCLFPLTSRAIGDLEEILPEFANLEANPDGVLDEMRQLRDQLAQYLETRNSGFSSVADVLKYESVLLALSTASAFRPSFPFPDRLNGQKFTVDSMAELRPIRSQNSTIEVFSYDIAEIAHVLEGQNSLETLAPKKTSMLLLCSSNMATRSFRVNAFTQELFQLCDGSRTVEEIMRHMAQTHSLELSQTKLGEALASGLHKLYTKGVIAFA